MPRMETLSVIVPVYNCADCLPACLDSLRAQSFPRLDILLVDDGSDDGSRELCEAQARQDPRFRVLSGAHGGAGAARNLGLKEAKGRYVLFVDSDDRCAPDLAEKLVSAAAGRDGVLVLCGIQVTDDAGVPGECFREEARSCGVREYAENILAKWKTNPLCGGVYAKLYNLALIRERQIFFEENESYAEDFCFNLQYLLHAESVTVLPDLLYLYRAGRDGSLTAENLNRADFAVLWQRRLHVSRQYESVLSSFVPADRHAASVAEFYALQASDMLHMAARRAESASAFHQSAGLLREIPQKHGIPSSLPAKERLSLSLLRAGRYGALRHYENLRLRVRRLRGREKWDK